MKRIIIYALFATGLTSCGDAFMGVYNDKWDAVIPMERGFDTAVNPGDVATVRIGAHIADMVLVNNNESITFPFGIHYADPTNNTKATLTRKFFLGRTEITNAVFVEVLQWAIENEKLVETPGAHNEVNALTVKYAGQELIDLDYSTSPGIVKISYDATAHKFSVETSYENHPVVLVSWYGAVMFCNWLTEMRDRNTDNLVYSGFVTNWDHLNTIQNASKSGYRLPSSEEWDYAARYLGKTEPTVANLSTEYIAQNVNTGSADLTPGYYWTPAEYASGATKDYNNETETRAVSWYSGDSDMGGNKAMPVAQKASNQLGLYDMCGNVCEWCFTVATTPDGTGRVLRGGGWGNGQVYIQLGDWNIHSPIVNDPYEGGFRIARTSQ